MSPRICSTVAKVAALLLLSLAAGNRSWALDAAAMQAMVIVTGDEGRGSGFVVKMDGKTYVVTNSHVVRGNRNVKFTNLRNTELAPGTLEIADQVDAVRAEVTGATNVLEIEPQLDKLKIGDEVVVAGNSEGEGVVREIPGKVVGIGPDRIEVDAQFVPGNSGSPILLKSTGKVIAIATYMKVPFGVRVGAKSPFSLNEVRRFGYRLDTVAKWVHPTTKDRLYLEGLKLAEMEELLRAVTKVCESSAAFVTKWGASTFVKPEQAKEYPAFATLSTAIDEFTKQQAAAKTDEDKTKNATAFFTRLKTLVNDDIHGLQENQFSGFYSTQLKESLQQVKEFSEWCDGTMMAAYRDSWLKAPEGRFTITSKPALDPNKIKLVLKDRVEAGEPADYCHHVGYPPENEPDNLENLYWIIEDPQGQRRTIAMHRGNVRVRTPINGTYKVSVEYRSAAVTRTVSNIVEVKYGGAAGGIANNEINATNEPPKPLDPSKPLNEVLGGTRWQWGGKPNEVLEFHKDGKVYFANWARQNLVTTWEATGKNQITLKILSGRKDNLTATLAFADDRKSFTGTDFDPNQSIARSERAPETRP